MTQAFRTRTVFALGLALALAPACKGTDVPFAGGLPEPPTPRHDTHDDVTATGGADAGDAAADAGDAAVDVGDAGSALDTVSDGVGDTAGPAVDPTPDGSAPDVALDARDGASSGPDAPPDRRDAAGTGRDAAVQPDHVEAAPPVDAARDVAVDTGTDVGTDIGTCVPTADAGPDQRVDPGTPVVLGKPAVAGFTYAWTCNRADCALSDPTAAQPTATPLEPTTYTLMVSGGAGCAAPAQATVRVAVNLQFTTVPAAGATAYPDTANVVVVFAQPVPTSALRYVTVEDADTGLAVETMPLPFDGTTLQLEPVGADYVDGGHFTLRLAGGAAGIQSDDAIQPRDLAADSTIEFDLGPADNVAPNILTRSPLSNATSVPINAAVTVTFDEALDPVSVTSSHVMLTGAVPVAGALEYDLLSATLIFHPTAPLSPSTLYTFDLMNVKDLSGNAVPLQTWSFTTGAASDTTGPTVTSTVPADLATSVESQSSITVVFSEPLDPQALGTATLTRHSDGAPVPVRISYDGVLQQITLVPLQLLGSATKYDVTVSGAQDPAGNAMAAPATVSFTTLTTLFADDFESSAVGWTLDAPWGVALQDYSSSFHALADSPVGAYASDLTEIAAQAPDIDVTGQTSVHVRFHVAGRTEASNDVLRLEYRFGGSDKWSTATTSSGVFNGGVYAADIPIPTMNTLPLQLRLTLTTNDTIQYDGVYVDDFLVQAP